MNFDNISITIETLIKRNDITIYVRKKGERESKQVNRERNFQKNQLTLYYLDDSFCKIVRVENFVINLSNKYFFIPEDFSLA